MKSKNIVMLVSNHYMSIMIIFPLHSHEMFPQYSLHISTIFPLYSLNISSILGLIGLAACAIGLVPEIDRFLHLLIPPVLDCFDDPESRVCYYAW